MGVMCVDSVNSKRVLDLLDPVKLTVL